MKQQAIQYVAFDVHQATTVATVRAENGSIGMHATVATEGRRSLVWCEVSAEACISRLREGTQAQWLHGLLLPHVTRVFVCNVRGRSETSNKSDRIDAD